MKSFELIHERAMAASLNYKNAEAELLEAIIQVRDYKAYRHFGCTSTYEYCVKILGLDAGVVYSFTAVAKKIKEVPELKDKIAAREINVSTAKRITSVITRENKEAWFAMAKTLSTRKLEKEVARVDPKTEVKERASYLNSKRIRLEVGLDESTMLTLRRIQDLESQRQRRSVTIEDTIVAMEIVYLEKNDPIEKAKRATIRKSLTREDQNPSTWKDCSHTTSIRKPIPAQIIHQVNLRDQHQCQFTNIESQKCNSRRFIEIHHLQPVSEGGCNEIENLISLCSEHHKQIHSLG